MAYVRTVVLPCDVAASLSDSDQLRDCRVFRVTLQLTLSQAAVVLFCHSVCLFGVNALIFVSTQQEKYRRTYSNNVSG